MKLPIKRIFIDDVISVSFVMSWVSGIAMVAGKPEGWLFDLGIATLAFAVGISFSACLAMALGFPTTSRFRESGLTWEQWQRQSLTVRIIVCTPMMALGVPSVELVFNCAGTLSGILAATTFASAVIYTFWHRPPRRTEPPQELR